MIFKQKFYITLIIIFFYSINFLNANIKIVFNVNDEIITNHDIYKESNYLKILNPQITILENDKIFELAKESLINETIKKKEINKLIKTEIDIELINKHIENLYLTLNIDNRDMFEKFLKKNQTYNIGELEEKIKVEFLWNKLIYSRYSNLVKINYNRIKSKIENLTNQEINEFFLSEIIFSKKKNRSINDYINEIKLSINDIGFNNTANIYSISDTSKLGGKVGWISENSLNQDILTKLKSIDVGEYTDVIQLQNNFLILKIEDIRINQNNLDKQKEFEKIVEIETNKQLNQFSKIYYNKIKKNYSLNEN
jgi:peptidyl-prolyl cis-trans isomerase SurA